MKKFNLIYFSMQKGLFLLLLSIFIISSASAGNYQFQNTTGSSLMIVYGANGNVSIVGNVSSQVDFCTTSGKCLSSMLASGTEVDPYWTANFTTYNSSWSSTINSSYARLDVANSFTSGASITMAKSDNALVFTGIGQQIVGPSSSGMYLGWGPTGQGNYYDAAANATHYFRLGGTPYFTISNSTVTSLGNLSVDYGTLFVDSVSNRVGIGTTSPSVGLDVVNNDGIRVQGAGESQLTLRAPSGGGGTNWTLGTSWGGGGQFGAFYVYENSSTYPRFVIRNGTGNVGIGTTSPQVKLHIEDSTNNIEEIRLGESTGTNFGGIIYNENTASLLIQNAYTAGGGEKSIKFNTSGGERVRIDSAGNVGINTTTPVNTLNVKGTFNVTNVTGSTALFVDTDGEVGIGTTGPNGLLHVYGASDNKLILSSTGAAATSNLFLSNLYGTEGWRFQAQGDSPGSLVISRQDDGGAFADFVIINKTGNVGIGITSPQQKLHVNGSAVINGTLNMDSNKIMSVANGTSAQDAVAYSQLQAVNASAASALNLTGLVKNWTVDIVDANNSLANYVEAYYLRNDGDNGTGTYNFNGGWTTGGATISGGNLYAQTLYVYNITSLAVSHLDINGSLLPQQGYDNTFDVGNATLRWRDLYLGRHLNVSGNASIDNNTFFVDSSTNKVGIGTTSPGHALDIVGSFRVNNAGMAYFLYNSSELGVRISNSNSASRAGIYLENDGGFRGGLGLHGTASSGSWGSVQMNKVVLFSDSASSGLSLVTADTSDPISFYTGGYNNERMTILGTGNVGIGTTSPGAKLHVSKTPSSSTDYLMKIDNNGSSSYNPSFLINFTGTSGKSAILVTGTGGASLASSGALNFHSNSDNNANNPTNVRMTIDTAGNVGINTTSPTNTLNVKGTFNVTNVTGSTALFVNETGNVGVGTTSPGGNLHVKDNSGSGYPEVFVMEAKDTSDPGYRFKRESAGASGDYYVRLRGSSGNTWLAFYSNSGTSYIDKQLNIHSNGNIGINTTTPTNTLNVKGTFNVTNSSSGTTNLIVDNYGRVGIGTTSPGARFDIKSSGRASIGFKVTQSDSANSLIVFNEGAAGDGILDIMDASGNVKNKLHGNGDNYITGGNVGIGTTSPSTKLEVNGTINASQILINGTPVSSITGTITGAGTYGYVPMWNSTTSINNSVIYQNGTNVGIGTTSPGAKLDVIGDSLLGSAAGYVKVDDNYGSNGARLIFGGGGVNHWASIIGDNTRLAFTVNDEGGSAAEYMRIVQGGNVGIGTTLPTSKLHVAGNMSTFGNTSLGSGALFVDNNTGNIGIGTMGPDATLAVTNIGSGNSFIVEDSANPDSSPFVIDASGYVGVGLATPVFPVDFQSQATFRDWTFFGAGQKSKIVDDGSSFIISTGDTSRDIRIGTNAGVSASSNLVISTTGNVGIGTTIPQQKLHVNGSAVINGTLNMDSNKIISVANGTSAQDAVTLSQLQAVNATGGAPETDPYWGANYSNVAFINKANTFGNFNQTFDTSTLFVDSVSDRVGIGTTAPNDTLHLSNTYASMILQATGATDADKEKWGVQAISQRDASESDFRLYTANAAYNSFSIPFTITHDGNVGIGTTSPGYKLDVNGSIRINDSGLIKLYTGGGGADDYTLRVLGSSPYPVQLSLSSDAGTNRYFQIGYHNAGVFQPKVVVNGYNGNVGIGTTSPTGTLSVNSSNALGSLRVYNTTGSEHLFVNGTTGNVGIGTTSPGNLLEVRGTAGTTGIIVTDGKGSSGGTSRIQFGLNDGSFNTNDAARIEARIVANPNMALDFKTYHGSLQTDMTIYNGNVGINTTSPGATLDVNGTVKIASNGDALTFTNPSTSGNVVNFGNSYTSIGKGAETNQMQINADTVRINARYGSPIVFINNTAGNVGIGTTSPQNLLHINDSGSSSQKGITLSNADGIGGIIGADNQELEFFDKDGNKVLKISSAKMRLQGRVETAGKWISFDGNQDDGITVDSSNNVLMMSGNVGIGTTSPTGTLSVNSSNALGSLRIYNTTGSEHLFINGSTGNVGIGTTSPGRQLEINGTNPLLKFNGDPTGEARTIGLDSQGFVIWNDIGSRYDLAIDNAGNVGINTSTPANTLNVKGTFNVTNITGSTALFVDTDGEVGIGTTSPGYPLHVVGSGYVSTILGVGTTPSAGFLIDGSITSAGIASYMRLNNPQAAAANVGGKIIFAGTSGVNTQSTITSAWEGSDNTNGFLAIDTRGSGTVAERMRITSAGRVGIGTIGPSTELDVNGTINASQILINGTPIGTGGISWATAYNGTLAKTDAANTFGNFNQSFNVSTLFIDATNGRVGIGTTSPGRQLDVAGVVRSSRASDNVNFEWYSTTNSAVEWSSYLNGENLRFQSEGGSDVLALLKGGNVGINTTSPTNTLNVKGTFNVTNVTGSTALFVDTDGDVGIGTTSPGYKLTIGSGTGAQDIMLNSAAANQAGLWFSKAGVGKWGVVVLSNSNDLSIYDVASGVSRMTFNSSGNVGINTTIPTSKLHVAGNMSTFGNTSLGSGALLVDNNTGNVGIGTTSPSTKLDVNGSMNISATASNPYLYFGKGGYMYDNGTATIIGHS